MRPTERQRVSDLVSDYSKNACYCESCDEERNDLVRQLFTEFNITYKPAPSDEFPEREHGGEDVEG